MSQRYLGGIITANPTTPTMTSESGVWTLEQQFQYSNVWSPKIVGNSVRLRSSASAYFNRTPSVSGNQQKWTWSAWVKQGNDLNSIFSTNSAGNTTYNYFGFSSNSFRLYQWNGTGYDFQFVTTAVYRDPSAWYHFVISVDTTQATAANRVRLYVNGVEVTSFSTNTTPSQNLNTYVNSTSYSHLLGRNPAGSATYFDGYLAEINFVDGQQLTPSSFGAYDNTGTWQPLPYTGTYGTNGFYLTFADNSAATAAALGKDYSGNGNNWTPNNISLTAGTTYDWMLDSPTNWTSGTGNGVSNYCVLNPLDKDTTNGSLSQGNLYWLFPAYSTYNAAGVRGTLGVNTGKWYWEFQNVTYAGSGNASSCGMTPYTGPLYGYTAFAGTIPTYIGANATVFSNSVSFVSYGMSASLATGTTLFASYASGDVINIAVDFDAGKIWIGKNGTWYNSGSPSDGTNATSTFTTPSTSCFPEVESVANLGGTNVSSSYPNFGQRPFSYTVPTGFKALNTLNLPDSNITNGAQYMAATTYTGNGSTLTVTNGGNNTLGTTFKPDFVWVKDRTGANNHCLFDSVRGVYILLNSNATAADQNFSTSLTSFNSNGFSLGNYGNVNLNSSSNYIAWQWQAGQGTTLSNTSGSITSTVSVNTKAGFSVVTYTGNGTNGATIGHGLGVAPSMIIVKDRTSVTSWGVYFSALGNTGGLYLNGTNAFTVTSLFWNNTSPTSTVFSVSTNIINNQSGDAYVAYCWAAVAGYSAFGSYTGNGSADGPFVYLGFRPRWVLFKRSDSTSNWLLYDTSRLGYNQSNNYLLPDLSNAEGSGDNFIDILSNGFKVRIANQSINTNGATYIYAAFAENPFKIARAR